LSGYVPGFYLISVLVNLFWGLPRFLINLEPAQVSIREFREKGWDRLEFKLTGRRGVSFVWLSPPGHHQHYHPHLLYPYSDSHPRPHPRPLLLSSRSQPPSHQKASSASSKTPSPPFASLRNRNNTPSIPLLGPALSAATMGMLAQNTHNPQQAGRPGLTAASMRWESHPMRARRDERKNRAH
jgi:hypothetical protein